MLAVSIIDVSSAVAAIAAMRGETLTQPTCNFLAAIFEAVAL